MKTNKTIGYIVHSSQHGVVCGYCTGQSKETKNVLWAGGNGWKVTLFKTKRAANEAIRKTEEYARSLGYLPSTHPIWFDDYVVSVREA